MSTINIYQISKEEIMYEIDKRPAFLKKVTKYVKLTQPNSSQEAATIAAKELIYQNCMEQFRFSEYVRTASDAVRKVSDEKSSLMMCVNDVINKENKRLEREKEQKKEAERRKKEEAERIEKLKAFCEKEGLDFEVENQKYLKKLGLWNNIFASAVLASIVGFLVTLVINIFKDYGDGTVIKVVMGALPWAFVVIGIASFFLLGRDPKLPSEKKNKK